MTEDNEVRANREDVEGFVSKLREFHGSLSESEQAMFGTILDGAVAGETGGYGGRYSRSGEGQSQPWEDLVGWIEEQGEEDAQGFAKRFH